MSGSTSSNSISGSALRRTPRQPKPRFSLSVRLKRWVTERSPVSSLHGPSRSTLMEVNSSAASAGREPIAKYAVCVSPAVAGTMFTQAVVASSNSSNGVASASSHATRVNETGSPSSSRHNGSSSCSISVMCTK